MVFFRRLISIYKQVTYEFFLIPALIVLVHFLFQYYKYGSIIDYDVLGIFLLTLMVYLSLITILVISLLPRLQIGIKQFIECPICYEESYSYYELKCKHCYCIDCLNKWMDVNNRCPYCRNAIS